MDLMSIVMTLRSLAGASRRGGPGRRSRSRRTPRPPRSGPSAHSSGRHAADALGISLSATNAPSSGLTRSSRPQVSRVCLRSRWASRQSMPSSAVSGFQKDIPIERIASWAPGAVASAKRSSTSSSVTSDWLTTIVEMNARRDSRRRVRPEVHQPLDPLGRVGVEEVERQPARTHQDQPSDPVGVGEREPHRRTATEAVAEQVHPLDAELVEQLDDVVGRVTVVVADHRRLVGAAEAGLVDEQGAELPGEGRQRRPEVRPRRGARARHRGASPAAGRHRCRSGRPVRPRSS